MPKQRKIASHWMYSYPKGIVRDPLLTFDESTGELLSVEHGVRDVDSRAGVEFFSGILIPGTVNCHTHLELSYLKGAIRCGTGLTGFVGEISRLRGGYSVEEMTSAADVRESLMYAEGVAAVGDICNSAITFHLKKKSRIHFHNFIELFSVNGVHGSETLERGCALGREAEDSGLEWSLTPHSTYSVNEHLFNGIISSKKGSRRRSVHFMESPDESALYTGSGMLTERYKKISFNPDFLHHGSPAERLIRNVPKDTPLLLVHNTFVGRDEIARLEDRFEDLFWVVCPRSNDYIEGAKPPLDLFVELGCRVAIGTDSLSSNDSLSMADEIRYVVENFDVPFEKALEWATIGGAAALGLNHKIGSFEPGKRPGAALIDSRDCASISRII